jgi:putative membrane protein
MIATPLAGRGRRAVLANVVVGGLAATTTAVAWRRWGGARSTLAASATVAAATLVEKLGTTTGVPFGRYAYSGALRPRVAGVPMAVPAAWFVMALPARETAHAVLGPSSPVSSRVALGAAGLTAWDLFLDPQMTAEGHWQWRRPGRYRGIPATNFLGWFATSLALMILLESVLPPAEAADPAAVALYAWMAVMQTLGFALFFRDPLVAVVGGLAMLPLAVVAARRAGLVTPLRARRGGGDG